MKQTALITIVNICFLLKESYSQTNPCPEYFRFQSDNNGLHGIITIPGPGTGITRMEAKFGIRGQIYNSSSGGLKLRKPLQASVDDARKGRDVQYILNFPQSQQAPMIIRLTLNNRDICTGVEANNVPKWTFQHEFIYPSGANYYSRIPDRRPNTLDDPTPPRPVTPAPTRPPPRPVTPAPTRPPRPVTPAPTRPPIPAGPSTPSNGSWVTTLGTAATCGRKPGNELEATKLIIGGENVEEGEFPWMVALFHSIVNPVYKCGASLLSNTVVITAAHCTDKQERVYVELGRHNISNTRERDYVSRISIEIFQHPDYVSAAHGDVALIIIERVEFTPKIVPICLWWLGTNLDGILRTGIVTGWGRTENDGDLSTVPLKLEVRTVGLETCRNSHAKLRDIATDKTFCAGGNSSGPCHGDSGSGFYIRHSRVFYLRGIISTSLGNDYVCNLSEYAVYVDLAYYLDWIRLYLTSF